MTSKVIFITGSEGGHTETALAEMQKRLNARKEAKFAIVKCVNGTIASKEFVTLASDYDVAVIGTSSFGDGEAPSTFDYMLRKLYEKKGEGCLKGLQHAVLGFGSTAYETFQNCPRLTDRLFEECGSRRFLERVEIDELDDDEASQIKAFEDGVFKFLQNPCGPGDKAVCEFSIPEGAQLHEQNSGGIGDTGDTAYIKLVVCAVLVAVSAYSYTTFV